MLKRTIRERREYLYRKALEGPERERYEKRRRIKEAIANGQPIPTELREDAVRLANEGKWDDAKHGGVVNKGETGDDADAPLSHEDDEYSRAGLADPVVLVTTSRDPSSRLSQFAKELRLIFPNATRVNRGGYVLSEIVSLCRRREVTDLVIAHEHRGEPDGVVVCHLPYGPTAFFALSNCVLRHDIEGVGTASEAYPHLIFDNFKTKLGERTASILKYLFPVPKPDTKRVITFSNNGDLISFRHHVYGKKKEEGSREIDLKEVGPRFEMKLFQIKLGTVDQQEAETEWVLRPYMTTSKKRERL